MSSLALTVLLAATALNGLIAGVSLGKSLVELPAGRRLGPTEFARFSRAADHGNGRILYPVLGVGGPALTILATLMTPLGSTGGGGPEIALEIAVVLSIAHLGATLGAAPRMLEVGRLGDDEPQLARAYRRFTEWHSLRTALQVAAFLACLAALRT